MITRTIDTKKKQEFEFMIQKKWPLARYYLYTTHWKIIDIGKINLQVGREYKGKKYRWGYFYKGIGMSGVLDIYDLPVVTQIDRKVNKDTGEVLDYNWEEWTD